MLVHNPIEIVAAQHNGDRYVQTDGIQLSYRIKRKLIVHSHQIPSLADWTDLSTLFLGGCLNVVQIWKVDDAPKK